MTQLLGKPLAISLKEKQLERVAQLQSRHIEPALDIILLSKTLDEAPYVMAKQKACQERGIICRIHLLPPTTTQQELMALLHTLNTDTIVRAIICQLPLPTHIDTDTIVRAIDPQKDVDGFHPQNLGGVALGHPGAFTPCTPKGILYMLRAYQIPLLGKHVVILGRSRIVGLPLHLLLSQKSAGATVTLCHSQTANIIPFCRQADVLVSAMGRPRFVQKDWIKPGAVVIDVGTTRVPDATKKSGFALQGDCCLNVAEQAGALTPVPGGVGPLTVAMVIENCLEAWERV